MSAHTVQECHDDATSVKADPFSYTSGLYTMHAPPGCLTLPVLCLRPSPALAAENLFLRKQLALYQEHHVTSRRASHAARITLLWLSQWFDWQPALAVVQPETFKRWRRQGYHLFWHWTPCPGRPPIPMELQRLIRQMARENLTWGQRRIANELQLKLGLRVSPRTVRKYLPRHLNRAPGQRLPSQRWRTFVHNHAWDGCAFIL
jgi:putative transposase